MRFVKLYKHGGWPDSATSHQTSRLLHLKKLVSLQTVQQSNAKLATLPKGLVALFISATSGIGQSALEQCAQNAAAPRVYTVARPHTAPSHEKLLSSLRKCVNA